MQEKVQNLNGSDHKRTWEDRGMLSGAVSTRSTHWTMTENRPMELSCVQWLPTLVLTLGSQSGCHWDFIGGDSTGQPDIRMGGSELCLSSQHTHIHTHWLDVDYRAECGRQSIEELGEMSVISDMQMTPPLWQKKEPLDESESGEWKRWLKTQHSEN